MNITEFNEQEFESILDDAQESGIDIEQHVRSSFESLLFLGGAVVVPKDQELLDIAIFNIRLCYVYFKRKEDYDKLSKLIKLTHVIDDSRKAEKVVDVDVIDSIDLNLN